jgi:hypothetical protein
LAARANPIAQQSRIDPHLTAHADRGNDALPDQVVCALATNMEEVGERVDREKFLQGTTSKALTPTLRDSLQARLACDTPCDVALRRPLQVWLPARVRDPAKAAPLADVLAAYDAYRGDWVVHFKPRLRRESRRGRFPFASLSLPAHQSQAMTVEVFHVGRNGYVWGPRCHERFPDARIDGLLDDWLHLDARNLPSAGKPQRWPDPFRRLFPREGASTDDLRVRDVMVAIAKGSGDNLAPALLEATNRALPYVTEPAYSFYLHAELGPQWVEHGREPTWLRLEGGGRVPRDRELHLALRQARPRIADPRLLHELSRDPWREKLVTNLVPVRRCWGVAGLFWALLVDHLECNRSFETCRHCDWLLPRSRRQCGRRDNLRCYRDQATRRQWQTRDRNRRRR